MKFTPRVLGLILLCAASSAFAQQPAPDPIAENFFPPELVMEHSRSIGLTEEQKTLLKSELRKVQTRFTELQWQLQDEGEKMVSLVKQARVDEKQVLAQLDMILDLERQIKHEQVALVVKIKNILTQEQQAQLQEIRNKARQK